MTTEPKEPINADEAPLTRSNSTPAGTTQVGQVIAGLERLTRRLPATRSRRLRPYRSHKPAPPREQIAALISALGDAEHPLHSVAVDDLVEIGAPAVPAICEALTPNQPWLTIYRAAEAAGRIGDGRAAGALMQALRHPNSNVRWSAVRALTQVGDVRALMELRRVAQQDQGRTSWGEPLAGAAQMALNQLNQRSVWGQSVELIKTAVTCVLMILALTLAFGVVTTLRDELDRFGRFIPGQTEIPQFILPTVAPTAVGGPDTPALAATAPQPALAATTPPTDVSGEITGTVLQSGNVRPFPSTDNQPIGRVNLDDEVIFLGRSANSQWYLIRLGESRAADSQVNSSDGSGWVNRALLSEPVGDLPVIEPEPPPSLAPTTAPSPTP